MTAYDDFGRTLVGWFEADAQSAAPAGNLERVLEATRRRSPRPAWLAGPGSHWVGEAQGTGSSTGARSLPGLGLRWSTALIVIVVISAIVGGAILVGAGLFSPSPVPILPSPLPAKPSQLSVKPSPSPVNPSALPVKPSPPPTGHLGHLAYGIDGSVYVADWDGRNSVRIATGVYFYPGGGGLAECGTFWGEGPIWSPDGRYLAYRSAWDASCLGTPGAGQVYVADPEGHVLASFPGTGWLVSWSPNSTRVATWVDPGHTIGIYGLDGVRQVLLTVPPGCSGTGDFDPVWSPDPASLVVSTCVIPVDGGTPWRAPVDDPLVRGAAYSRDGARMAFIVSPDGAYNPRGVDPFKTSLVIADADGAELRVLPGDVNGNGPGPGVYGSPVLSPTGDRVAFTWSPAFPLPPVDPSCPVLGCPTAHPSPSPEELLVVDVASGAVTTTGDPGYNIGVIGFSPEGDRILISTSDANNTGTSLWSVRADGSESQQIVQGTGWGDWQSLPAGP